MEDHIKSKCPTLWKEVDKEMRPEKCVDPVDLAQIKVASSKCALVCAWPSCA